MGDTNTLQLYQFPSFCKALGITSSDIDSAVAGQYQCTKKVKFNYGAIEEIFRHLNGSLKPLYSAICAFSDDFSQIPSKTLHSKAKKSHNKIIEDRRKNKPAEFLAYLSSDFFITPQSEAHKLRKENESLKRRLDEQRETMETEIEKFNTDVEQQVEKKVKVAAEGITKQHASDMQSMKEKLKEEKEKRESKTRNLTKQVKRRSLKVEELKAEVEDAKKKAMENAKALKAAEADVHECTAQMAKLEEQMATARRAKRLAQKKCSYYRNIAKGRKEEKQEDAKDVMIVNLEQKIADHVADLRYYEDLVTVLQSDVIETFEDGKYVNELRELIMILLTTGSVSMRQINFVMSQVVEKLSGKTLSRLPSKAVLHRLLMEAKTISDVQVCEAMLAYADPVQDSGINLHSDGTSKFHRHYEGFQLTTPSGQTMTLATVETSGGSAEELIKAFTDSVSMLAKSIESEETEEDIIAKLIASIKSTMSDQGSVNPCFNAALKTLRDSLVEKVVPNWDALPSKTQDQVKEMTHYFCKMHIVVNFALEADKVLKMFEDKVTEGKNPYALNNNESGSVRLLRLASQSFTSRGDRKSGIHSYYNSELEDKGKENEIVTYKGNRFNITFYNGAAVYYHMDDIRDFLESIPDLNNLLKTVAFDIQEPAYLAGIRALGIIDKVITGPYWRLLEADGGILTLNDHLHQMKITMEGWSKDASELLTPDAFLFKEDVAPIHRDKLYEKLLEPSTPEIDSLTQLALEVMMTSLQMILERQAKDNLPGGKYWNPTEQQMAAANHIPKTNTISERDFGMLDHIINNKPSAGVHVLEVIIMWTNNGTAKWLAEMDRTKKDKLLDRARKFQPTMKMLLKERKETLRVKKLAKLKDRQARKVTIEEKRHDNRIELTQQLTAMGGLWQTGEIDERLLLYPTDTAKVTALYTQLTFHKSILSAKGSRTLFQKQCKGVSYSVAEMTVNLKQVLELNTSGAAPTAEPGLRYVAANERAANVTSLKLALRKRLYDEQMKRRANDAVSKLPVYLKEPSKLVGRLILHQCIDPVSRRVEWYDAEVLEIHKAKENPISTEYHVRYGGNPNATDGNEGDEDEENVWHFPLLEDMRKGDVILLG